MSISELRRKLYDIDARLADALQHLRDQQAYICNFDAGEHRDTLSKLFCCLLREYSKLEIWREFVADSVADCLIAKPRWRLKDRSAFSRGQIQRTKKGIGGDSTLRKNGNDSIEIRSQKA
jgi:hypothetical protein